MLKEALKVALIVLIVLAIVKQLKSRVEVLNNIF